MVDDPVRLPLEEGRGRMDEDGRLLHHCLVSLQQELELKSSAITVRNICHMLKLCLTDRGATKVAQNLLRMTV